MMSHWHEAKLLFSSNSLLQPLSPRPFPIHVRKLSMGKGSFEVPLFTQWRGGCDDVVPEMTLTDYDSNDRIAIIQARRLSA